MNQDILIRIIRAAALGIVNECDLLSSVPPPETLPPAETEAPKPKATRAKKVEAPPAPAAEPVAQPASEPAAESTNVVDFIPEPPVVAAPASKATTTTIDDIKAYAYTIGKKANGGVATEAGTKARNWLKKNFDVEGIDAIPDVGDNYDRVMEMLIKVGATDSRKPAPPPAPDEL